jgi:voltage-gated sodium channel
MVKFAQRLVASRTFQTVVVAVILLAGVLAGLETNPALRAAHAPLLLALDRLVLAIFVAEILLKLAACGRRPLRYFADGWNVFDFLIVAACFLPVGGPFAAVLRLTRVFRLLRLVHALPKLQLLVGALLKSLSAMGYVTLLLGLLFYIYAVAGVHLFAASDPADFGTLPAALFTLFEIVTLDNWGDAFNRTAAHAPVLLVSAYFVSFIVLGTMIILNLFIGIVMNSMAEMHKELEQEAPAPAGTERPGSLNAELEALERQVALLQSGLRAIRDRRTGPGPAGQTDGRPPT